MPELPELEVVKDYLSERIRKILITKVTVKQPLVFRCLLDEFESALLNNHFTKIDRRGKFLLFHTNQEKVLVINLMLTGRIQYTPQKTKIQQTTCFRLLLANDYEFRYLDKKKMGRIYLVPKFEMNRIPQFSDLGSEPFDKNFTLDEFKKAVSSRWGMIKNVLTNQKILTGIGNAYSDEILFKAGILPLRKTNELSEEEIERLFYSIRIVLTNAIEMIRGQTGDDIHQQNREFMKVHNKARQSCPNCGTCISELKPDGKMTNFCRTCQV